MGPEGDTQQFERLRALFDRIAELDPVLREAVIHSACGEDADMERELRALLDAHDREHGRTGETRVRLLDEGRQALAAAAEPGERVGQFVLREVLGRGGMGVVYRAERADGEVRQQVAVKVLQRMHLDEAGVRRFAQERDIVAQLSHPGIARLFDAGTTRDGSPYYAMELVDGQPITAWCDARKLSIPERLDLFLKVCDAVRFAHANLVLHRDIKPANVLVDANGAPKLIDFGIAKPIIATDDTATGLQLFSPSNAAPEQLRGERCGVACDVYQLGTLLYELLAGDTVLGDTAGSAAEIEAAVLHHVPPRPSDVAAHKRNAATAKLLRGDIDTIVLRALRKEPERRYASVEQLADEIRRYLRKEPIAARGGERAYRLRKFVERHRAAAAVGAAIVLLTVAFVATLLEQAQRLQRERDTARLERDRADEVAKFASGVFESADPTESLSRDTKVGVVLDNARTRVDRDLQQQPALRARLLTLLGGIYLNLDDDEQALALADAAGTLLESGATDLRARLEHTLLRARALHSVGKLADAHPLAVESLRLHATLGDSPTQTWETRFLEISTAFDAEGPDVSMARVEALVREVESDPDADPRTLAKLELELGGRLTGAVQAEKGEAVIRNAIARLAKVLPAEHPEVLEARIRLADVLDYGIGRSEEAIVMLEDVYRMQQAAGAADSHAAGTTQFLIGNALSNLKRWDEAIERYERAGAIFKALHPEPHPDHMAVAWTIGSIHRDREQWQDAERYFRDAVTIAEQTQGPHNRNAATARGQVGLTLVGQGRLAEAEQLFAAACADLDPASPRNYAPFLSHADVLAKLGRTAEASRQLARIEPTLEPLKDKRREDYDRARALRTQLGPIQSVENR